MSEEDKIGEQNADTGFEHEDWSPRTVYYFLLGVGVMCLVVFFFLRGMYAYLDARSQAMQPPQNPLVATAPVTERNPPRAQVQSEIRSTFPEPRLEDNERQEINGFRLHEEDTLNSYGWVDQQAGVVHIPIERAMQLVAQRGLPVKPETDHGGTAKPKP
ncbi:MAG TPA: hypothetical protein VLW84_08225 [Terriglobales bacterium]|nr:hypothetical protein [Terriglobales bacterium]